METKELMIGNYVLCGEGWAVVENIHSKSVNVEICRAGEGGFTVTGWTIADEISPIPLPASILEGLGFRYFHQRYI